MGGCPACQGPRPSGAAGSPARGHLLAALPQSCDRGRRRAPVPHAHGGEVAAPGTDRSRGEAVHLWSAPLRHPGPGPRRQLLWARAACGVDPCRGPLTRPPPAFPSHVRSQTVCEGVDGAVDWFWLEAPGPPFWILQLCLPGGGPTPSQDEGLPKDASLGPGPWKRGSGGSGSGCASVSRGLVSLDGPPFVGPPGHSWRVTRLLLLHQADRASLREPPLAVRVPGPAPHPTFRRLSSPATCPWALAAHLASCTYHKPDPRPSPASGFPPQ